MIAEHPMILLVEDDQDIRETIIELLEAEGYGAAGVADGVAALEFLRAADPKPRCILLDLMMPRMNGAQFRKVQLRDPALADIPVVLLSADANLCESSAQLGAAGWLEKPLRLDALLEVAERFTRA